MPSRKQRRREQKSKRHQYEFVYVDAEGNELEEPPDELLEAEETRKKERTNGAKPAAARQQGKQASGRARREPPPPSWSRAAKRALLLGAVVFVLFSLSAGKASNRYVAALVPAVIYTVLFIPFTFWIDRFTYRRWHARQAAGSGSSARPEKKR